MIRSFPGRCTSGAWPGAAGSPPQWSSRLCTTAGKLFAAGYALFSGLLFIVLCGILFGPVVHRFLHHFHLEEGRKRGGV
jgi:hypothetical protein